MDARLVIYSPGTSTPTDIPISAEIPISITLAIADVREPDKRNSSFSKTLTLPGTKILNKLFEHIFDIPTNLSNFNPNLKTRCEYYVRSERVFEGDIQLLKIRKSGKPYFSLYYECSIVGRLANMFLDLGNSLLTDLDFSDLNHVFNYTNRNWTPTLGAGYTYPLIDYGVTGGCGYYWDFAHLSPAIFEKEYIDRIFSGISKTYTSTYFTSTYGKSILIPRTNEGALKMTNSQVNAVSFYAGRTTDTGVTNLALTYSGGVGGWTHPSFPLPTGLNLTQFDDDSTTPFYDGGNNYSTITSQFVVPITMETKASTLCNFKVRLNPPATTTGYAYTAMPQMNVDIVIVGVGNVTGSASFTFTLNSYVDVSVQVTAPNVIIPANTIVTVIASIDPSALIFYNGATPISAGTSSIDVYMTSTSWFSATSATGNLPIGYTVDMSQCVPKDIKQIDFLMSVIKSENLYMELDLTDSNNYIIEKRSDFFTANSTALDWTSKWDFQKEIEIIPMGELDFRKYLFTYKKDGDKFNKQYFDSYGEVYAQKYVLVNNDFIKNEKKTELIFSATPMVGNNQTNLVYPMFAQIDGFNVKPMAVQIRRLYWGGVIQMPGGVGAFYGLINSTNGVNPVTFSTYPFAGSVDNPYAPTLSLDWGIPQILYYQFPGQVWTNNNLYVRNYQRFIEQITNQNSKIVVMWMRLRPTDISMFSFRTPIFIDGSYYLVNKIIDYDPQKDEPVKVEFLRLAYVDAPITEDIEIWNNGEGAVSGVNYGIGVNPNGNNPNGVSALSSGLSVGQNNISNGEQSGIIGGEFNFIGGNNGV